MTRSKLPSDAFAYYVSLGPDRSYQAVARYFQVDKTTVVRRATLDRWQDQLAEIERKAQTNTQEKLVDTLTEMNERHLKILRVVLGKALEALRSIPVRNAADAVRAIDVCVKHERVILGEPSERTDISMEQIIRGEYDRWMRASEPKTPAPEKSLRGDKAPTAPSVNDNVLAIGNETEEDSDDDA